MAERPQIKRVDVAFAGGQVLALRATVESYDGLVAALEDDSGPRWHDLQTEDSVVRIDLSKVVYVRRETEEHRVGF